MAAAYDSGSDAGRAESDSGRPSINKSVHSPRAAAGVAVDQALVLAIRLNARIEFNALECGWHRRGKDSTRDLVQKERTRKKYESYAAEAGHD